MLFVGVTWFVFDVRCTCREYEQCLHGTLGSQPTTVVCQSSSDSEYFTRREDHNSKRDTLQFGSS